MIFKYIYHVFPFVFKIKFSFFKFDEIKHSYSFFPLSSNDISSYQFFLLLNYFYHINIKTPFDIKQNVMCN